MEIIRCIPTIAPGGRYPLSWVFNTEVWRRDFKAYKVIINPMLKRTSMIPKRKFNQDGSSICYVINNDEIME